MSLNSVPSKVEVMGWNPQSLADYMRRLKLSGCDRLVIKSSINGAQFVQMTACDLQVFPSLYVPIITKIQNEINKMDQKKGGFGLKSKAQKYPKQVFVQEELWDSDEFDNDSDHDYESSNQEEGEDSYICALTEPQTTEQEDSDEAYEESCDEPSSADIIKPLQLLGLAKHQDSHYRDPVREPTPAERTSKPPHPHPPRMSHTSQRPFKAPAPASQPNLTIDRSKKPGHSGPSQTDLKKSKGSTDRAPGSSTSKTPKPRPPKHIDVANRADKPVPPVPVELSQVKNSMPGPRKGLDPSWYGGKVTRHQAEAALREVNKDGAFVVRDSTQGKVEHPYTLMLLKEGRVYNIMIRNQGNSYSLGTGLKNTKSFPGVKEMITHHTHTPLLLIDATDQSSEAPSQCCLLHPAGL
ncbi:lymphocyte cytosolic protein 2 isoform X2 [Epinephelus fuscoguttatus]|uniref:lymphocyte cytosolic protein 2 isoform X2 n=1 Tax=Epinephelus fuscoguttatus TaxID=293821 RepID=UPI0020D10FDA|nr:lymphocyte cytosolic protein 2 isoform X2 [Epinephelus fuscoguttatus]